MGSPIGYEDMRPEGSLKALAGRRRTVDRGGHACPVSRRP